MDPHAQLEIRKYADVIGNEIVVKWLPMTWQAFVDYRLNGMSFSGPELEFMRAVDVLGEFNVDDVRNYEGMILFARDKGDGKGLQFTGEGKEFSAKLKRIKEGKEN